MMKHLKNGNRTVFNNDDFQNKKTARHISLAVSGFMKL